MINPLAFYWIYPADMRLPWSALTVVLALVALLALAIGIGLSVFLVQRVWRIRWKETAERLYLHLRNNGNQPTALQISAVSPDGQLCFGYTLDGAALTPTTGSYIREEPIPQAAKTAALTAVAPAASPVAATAASPQQPSRAGAAPDNGKQPAQAPKAAQAAQTAVATATQAESKANAMFDIAGIFALILSTLGSLLPGSAGRAFSQKSAEVKNTVASARYKVNTPMSKVRQAQRLHDQVDTLQTDVKAQVPGRPAKGAAVQTAAPSPEAAGPAQTAPAAAPLATQAVAQAAAPTQPLRLAPHRETFASQVVQLPPMPPETGLTLELRVGPRNPYRSGEYTFWLLTQTVEPIHQPEPEKTVRRVKVRRLPLVYGALSVVLSGIAILFNAAWVAALVLWLARLSGTL